jgi:hypothetical protein
MKQFIVVALVFVMSCFGTSTKVDSNNKVPGFSESEILKELDLATKNTPGKYFPQGNLGDIKYNFFLDLESPYCVLASSRIHLFADSTRWAIVFETCGYETRSFLADIALTSFGNCINYNRETYNGFTYISNAEFVYLIDENEMEHIRNKTTDKTESIELVDPNVKTIKIHDSIIPFENDYRKYEQQGIKVSGEDNPQNRIRFSDILRYLNATNPTLISATEKEIKKNLPSDLPKLMTITDFHYMSLYHQSIPPSKQEAYQLIAKILVARNTALWKPTQNANNHWSNWSSGTQ